MWNNTAVVTSDKGTPDINHQGGAEKKINPDGGYLQAMTHGGRDDPNNSATSGYPRWNSGRGVDCSGSTWTEDVSREIKIEY